MADTRIIAIDDKIIFFQKTDLPKDLQGDVELLLQNYSGGYVPNLSSKADVVLSGSARLTVSEVARIEAILLPINQRSVHIDAVKYADRLAPVVAARLAEMQFVTYSDSSGSFEEVRADTGPDANNLDETSTTQGLRHLLDLGEADLSQHFVYYMSYPVATGQADSLNRVYFWKENEIFQRITFYEEVGLGFHPASLKVFNDYLTKYQIDLDAAVAILTQHHPDLDSNLIRLTLYYLILLELSLYDQMDAKQDLAAARSSDSLDYQLYWDAFVDWTSPLNAYSGSLVGNYAWQLSSAVLLDVGNQGFGPVQIIPNLLQKAYEDERVYPAFATHLSADKLATQDARLNTILNPRDSIYAKAMTLDLQLYQFTDKPTWTIPIDHAPYLPDVDDAHQFAVVYAANCLVQKPESGDHLKTKWVDGQYGVFMKSLAVLADVTNVPFPFASFGVFTASQCPGESVGTYAGYFYREGDTVKHCLRTSKLYPSAPFQP